MILDTVVHIRCCIQCLRISLCFGGDICIVDLVGHGTAVTNLQADLDISDIGHVLAQREANCLIGSQIHLVIGAVADVIGNAGVLIVAIDEHCTHFRFCTFGEGNGNLAVFIYIHNSVSRLDNLAAQFNVVGPAFTVRDVSLLDCLIDIAILAVGGTCGIVNTDCIQIQIVAIVSGLIHKGDIGSRDSCGVLSVRQILNLHDRNLIQRIRIIGTDGSIRFQTVVGIDEGILHQIAGIEGSAGGNLHCQCTGLVGGNGDHIKAGTVEGEFCGCILSGSQMDAGSIIHGVGAHAAVGRIVTVNIVCVKLGQAVLAGTVLALLCVGRVAHCPVIGEGQEIIFVVDSGCGDDGHICVVESIQSTNGILCLINKLVVAVHGSSTGCVSDLIAVDLCSTVLQAAFTHCQFMGIVGSGLFGVAVCHIGRESQVKTGQFAVVSKLVIFQNGDIHRQTVVDHHCIGNCPGDVLDREPDGGVGQLVGLVLVLAGIHIGFIGVVILAGITGNIGRLLAGTIHDVPAADTGTGCNVNIVLGTGVEQIITLGPHITCKCNQVAGDRTVCIQQNFLINNRLGYLISSQEVGSFIAVLIQRFTVAVDQIEAIADLRTLPVDDGRFNFLGNSVAEPVHIFQNCVGIGGIGAGYTLTLHGTFQIDHIGEGELLFTNCANIPNEGFSSQRKGSAVLQGDIHCFGSGVVEEGICTDNTVSTQDIHTFTLHTGSGNRAVRVEGNDFLGLAFTVGHTQLRCITSVSLNIGLGINRVFLNGDGGIHHGRYILSTGGHCGSHLQLEVIAQLILEHSIGSSICNLTTNVGESICQFSTGGCVNIQLLAGIIRVIRVLGSGLAQRVLCRSLGNVTVIGNIECQRVHNGTQTGNLIDIGLIGCGTDTCRLTDDLVGFIGITLNGVGHTVFVHEAVIVMIHIIIIVAVGSTLNDISHCFCVCPTVLMLIRLTYQTLQPNVPVIDRGTITSATSSTVVVELVGRTVGHEQHVQRTLIFAVCGLDSSTQPVDCVEGIVIVGASITLNHITGNIQFVSSGESTDIQVVIVRVGIYLNVCTTIQCCCVLSSIILGVQGGCTINNTIEICNGNSDIGSIGGRLQRCLQC